MVFAIYLLLRARYPLAVEHWTRGRVSMLTLAGLAAAGLACSLSVFAPRGRGATCQRMSKMACSFPGISNERPAGARDRPA